MTGVPGDTEEQRRAIRRFVQEHHPDRGGDPDTFVEGLRRLREGRPAAITTVEAHRKTGPVATLSRLSRSYQRWRRSRRRTQGTGRVQ